MATSHGNRFAFNGTAMQFIWELIKITLFCVLISGAYSILWRMILWLPYYIVSPMYAVKSIITILGIAVGSVFIGIYFCKWFVPQISYGSLDNRISLQFEGDLVSNIKAVVSENIKLIIALIISLVAIGLFFGAIIFLLNQTVSGYRNEPLFFIILFFGAFLAFMVAVIAFVSVITKQVVENASMNDKKFHFNKSSFEYFKIHMFELGKLILFTPLTLGIYPLFAMVRSFRITAGCIEYSGKKVEFDEEFDFLALLVISIVSGFFSAISFGLLSPWRFVVDTNKIFGYAKLK